MTPGVGESTPVRPGSPVRAAGVSRTGEWAAVTVLGLIFVITMAWWALALWPVPGSAPEWLVRTRSVCFNLTETGLPDASGWLVLVGQPLGMVGLLTVGWPGNLRRGLAALGGRGWGRGVFVVVLAVAGLGLGAASLRVRGALRAAAPPTLAGGSGEGFLRLDRTAPPALLVDQVGNLVGAATFGGRPLLVTFGFGHCRTVCPVVVAQAAAVHRALASEVDVALVVITLDPWRDTPERLPHLVTQWGLSGDARVLSGTVEEVEAALDAWRIPRSRNLTTGDIVHPALVYVVDGEGRIRYSTQGGVERLERLVLEVAG